jgi:hypothetical protein
MVAPLHSKKAGIAELRPLATLSRYQVQVGGALAWRYVVAAHRRPPAFAVLPAPTAGGRVHVHPHLS